jgi:acetolactate synthase-1/2/3 large subunit
VATLSTADAVVGSLIAHGIDTVFALPGMQNDVLFDSLHGVRDRLRVVQTRHEQGAAYMALGAAMATGKPAVYCVVPGPGFLNTTAALSTAYACNAPVLALTGQIPQEHIGRGLGFLHEIPDQLALMKLLTKWAGRIERPEDAPRLVNEAFHQLTSGRPRPAALECPLDVWAQTAAMSENGLRQKATESIVDQQAVAAAAELLLRAEHPVIVVGGGAQHASAQATELADLLQAPVIAGQMGFGVVDSRHPLSVNLQVGHRLWPSADVVLAVGTRLWPQQLHWGIDDAMKIIRVDADPEEIERYSVPEVGIVGDSGAVLETLIDLLREAVGPRSGAAAAEVQAARDAFERDSASLRPQFDFLNAIRSALPEDGIFVDEVTQMGHAARFGYPVYKPRTFITPGYQGTLGWGLATAIGVKIACPDRAVVSISGDGGFMFNVQELATAVLHDVAVVAVVFDDSAYGNVKRTQESRFDNHVIAAELRNPDFVELAESFGISATAVHQPDELRRALAEAIQADEPRLIHVPVGQLPDPWKFVLLPRIRGAEASV